MYNAQIKLVKFLVTFPKEWHSFAQDKETVGVVCACHNLGILEISHKTNQMRLKSEEKALKFLSYR